MFEGILQLILVRSLGGLGLFNLRNRKFMRNIIKVLQIRNMVGKFKGELAVLKHKKISLVRSSGNFLQRKYLKQLKIPTKVWRQKEPACSKFDKSSELKS